METIQQSIYDFPVYYDLIYGSDWEAECEFLCECFERFVDGTVSRLFEPACGTGRLLYRLGLSGYEVTGVDLNEKAIDFCNERLAQSKINGQAVVGDMTQYRAPKLSDAAFNTINSFRHLNSHKKALDHLKCTADSLRSGGIYVLGLHLTPTEIEPCEEESWIADEADLQVNTQMWLTERDLNQRYEKYAMHFEVYTPERFFRIEDELIFRTYTAPQMHELLEAVDSLEVVGTFDFSYRLENEIDINGKTEDVVYVLKKI